MNNNNNTRTKNNRPSSTNAKRNNSQKRGKPKGGKGVSTLNPNLLIKKASREEVKVFESKYTYSELNLSQKLKNNIATKGYSRPTEIQEASLNDLLAGKDMIGVASTGTGKTGAFLIPIIEKLISGNRSFNSLVVVPTRELALQVEEEFKSLTQGLNISVSCFIGGTNVDKDIIKLRRNNQLIIGTPGRLMDLSKRGNLNFNKMEVLVIDEFDKMLDMGFVHDIKRMVALMKNRKQTMLFSATIDKTQQSIITEIVTNPVIIKVSTGTTANSNIEQDIIKVSQGDDKFSILMDLMENPDFERVIIFEETKRLVDRLNKKLTQAGIRSGLIHGDKSQNFRTKAINQFKKGDIRVLVATDVAARGIDIDNVSLVINYQLPMTMDSYVHRIGRTGRAGKTGVAYTFVD